MVAALWGRLFRPIRENPHRTAPSNAQKQYTEFEAGELQKVLPRSDVSMHLLGVDNEKCADHQRGDKPQHKCVPIEGLRPALPGRISDGCGYSRGSYKYSEQEKSVDEPENGL